MTKHWSTCAAILAVLAASPALVSMPSASAATTISPSLAWTVAAPSGTTTASVTPQGDVIAQSNGGGTTNAPALQRLTPNGVTAWQLPLTSSLVPREDSLSVTDSLGNTYIALSDPATGLMNLESFSRSGTLRWQQAIVGVPMYVTLGADSNVYIADYQGRDSSLIERFDQATGKPVLMTTKYVVNDLTTWSEGLVLLQYSEVLFDTYDASTQVASIDLGDVASGYTPTMVKGASDSVFVRGYDDLVQSTSSGVPTLRKVTPAGVQWIWRGPSVSDVSGSVTATPDGGAIVVTSKQAWSINASGRTRWTYIPAVPYSGVVNTLNKPVVDVNGDVVLSYDFDYSQPGAARSYGVQIDFATQTLPASTVGSITMANDCGDLGGYYTGTSNAIDVGAGKIYLGLQDNCDSVDHGRIIGFSQAELGPDYATTLATPGYVPPTAGSIRYLAMGDSYSSGEGNPPFDAGTDSTKTGDTCHRSQEAWTHDVAKDNSRISLVTSIACSGARTVNVTSKAFKTESAQIKQLKALKTQPSLITISIGGNDAGFADVVADCARSNCVKDGKLASADDYIQSKLTPLVSDVLKQIKTAAPGARIVLVGYPNLMNSNVKNARQHCGAWLQGEEVTPLVNVATDLDQAEASAARTAGVDYVSTLSVLAGHELCTGVSYVRSLTLAGGQNRGHPLVPGQQAMASTVETFLSGIGY